MPFPGTALWPEFGRSYRFGSNPDHGALGKSVSVQWREFDKFPHANIIRISKDIILSLTRSAVVSSQRITWAVWLSTAWLPCPPWCTTRTGRTFRWRRGTMRTRSITTPTRKDSKWETSSSTGVTAVPWKYRGNGSNKKMSKCDTSRSENTYNYIKVHVFPWSICWRLAALTTNGKKSFLIKVWLRQLLWVMFAYNECAFLLLLHFQHGRDVKRDCEISPRVFPFDKENIFIILHILSR